MADTKISALTAATTPLAGTEVAPIVQSGVTVKAAVTSFTNGLALTPTSVTLATGNLVLNGGLTSNVALIKNTGRGYGAAADRWIGSDGTFTTWFYNVPTGGGHYFAVNQVNKLTVIGDNVNIPDGNLVPGTAAKGVNFTANTPAAGMTSRLLNWYEEGTWTPTVIGDSGAASGYSAQSGRYTRFGRTVFVSFHVALTNKGTISGEAKLGGLPFTVTNNGVSARATLSISIWESLATAKSWVALYTIANTTTAYFVASAGAVTSSENAMNTSAIGNTSAFIGSGVYEVA